MELSTFEITLIAGCFTILGCLITYYLSRYLIKETHRNAIELLQRQEFNSAANRLREAFMPIMEALNPAEFAIKDDLAIFLMNRFNEVRREVMIFSYFLDPVTKSRFLDAWHEYYRHPDHTDKNYIPLLQQYTCIGKTTQQQHEIKQLVKTKIDKILEFTKMK